MQLVGDCYRFWAFRYIREAKVDFSLASKSSMIDTIKDLSTIALRKTQLAIQYALAEPEFLDVVVSEYMSRGLTQTEPLIMLLARIRKTMLDMSDPQSKLTGKSILETTSRVLEIASSLVSESLGEKR